MPAYGGFIQLGLKNLLKGVPRDSGGCIEESSIPRGLLRLSHLSNCIRTYSMEKASLEGQQPGVPGPLYSLICTSVFGLICFSCCPDTLERQKAGLLLSSMVSIFAWLPITRV